MPKHPFPDPGPDHDEPDRFPLPPGQPRWVVAWVNSGAEACPRNLPLMLEVSIRAPGLADPVLLPAAAGIRLV